MLPTNDQKINRFLLQFETIVTCIKPIKVRNGTKWEITVKNLKNKIVDTSHFDAVFICNG